MRGANSTRAAAVDTSSAVLKLNGAKALVSALGIFIEETADSDDGLPVTGSLLGQAMHGIRLLLDDVSESMSKGASHA